MRNWPRNKTATIFNTDDPGWLELVSTYDEDFVSDLKFYVESQNRQWNPYTRSWRIRVTQKDRLVNLLDMNDYTFTEEELDWSKTGSLFDQLFGVIPPEYTTKVYFALANALHPDKGGSEEQMKQLNAAYDKVKGG